MRIGELAAASGVPEKTIRYYEGVGVLPQPDRRPNGYRSYTPSALQLLAFVRSAQAIGLSLGEIREVLGLRDRGITPCEHVVELIGNKAREIDAQIMALQAMRRDLRRLERRAHTLDPATCRADQICHVVAPIDSTT